MDDEERIAYRSLLMLVMEWRSLDGDGISDPLRNLIYDTLEHFRKVSDDQ